METNMLSRFAEQYQLTDKTLQLNYREWMRNETNKKKCLGKANKIITLYYYNLKREDRKSVV